MDNKQLNYNSSSWIGKVMRWILKLVLLFVILSLLITLAVQIPFIQKIIKNKTESYLEKKLQSEVDIKKVSFNWLSQLHIHELLVKDAQLDSAVYVGNFSSSIDMDLFDIINKRIVINSISLSDVTIKNKSVSTDSIGTLQKIIHALFPPKVATGEPSTSNIDLKLKSINLNNIRFINSTNGLSSDYAIGRLQANINTIELAQKIVDIESILIDKPYISIIKSPSRSSNSSRSFLDDTTLFVKLKSFDITNGQVLFTGWSDKHILSNFSTGFEPISVHLSELKLEKGKIEGKINEIIAINPQGVGIKSLQAEKIITTNKQIGLYKTQLLTTNSIIKDTVLVQFDSFADFKDFNNKILFNVNLVDSKISPQDLSHYIPSLKNSEFIQQYNKEFLSLNGRIKGSINDLSSNNLSLQLGNKLNFNGRFEATGLAHPADAFLSVRMQEFTSSVQVLKDLIPGLNKFTNLSRLGRLSFKGNFDGTPKNFVTYGILQSDLGYSKLDMQLNTVAGLDAATYNGELELVDFDLQQWTGDTSLGTITAKTIIKNGKGLRAISATADLETVISKFVYRDYDYTNVLFKGRLNKQLLDGNLKIEDANANLDFKGLIDFTRNIPIFDFEANIKNVDLYKLNLVKRPLAISGGLDFNVEGNTIDDIVGTVHLAKIHIVKDTGMVDLNDLNITSTKIAGGKALTIQSDWIDGVIEGTYKLDQVWPSLKYQLIHQFPDIAHSLKLDKHFKRDSTIRQSYSFDLNVKDVAAARVLLNQPLYAQPFHIDGKVDDSLKYALITWNVPQLRFKDFNMLNSIGRAEAKGAIAYAQARMDSTFSNSFNMPYMVFTSDMAYNKANFSISTPKVSNLVNNIDLKGTLELIDSTYHMKFTSSTVSFLERNWKILPDNEIAFRKGYLYTKNLKFLNGEEKINISSTDISGIKAEITDFDISLLNKMKPLPQWKLGGKINLKANIDDVFSLKGFRINGLVDSLYINKSFFGLIDFNVQTPTVNQPLQFNIAMIDQTRQLLGQGFYDISGKGTGIKNNYQFKLLFKDYPLRLFEYLIDDIIDQTKGNIGGYLNINRTTDGPDFDGNIKITDGGFKVNYLNTSYSIGEQAVIIHNKMIDATGVQIKDIYGNTALLSGGLLHKRFKDFSLSASLQSNRFLALNTTKENNPDYYGTLIGNIYARFYGPFDAINIDVRGVTARPSNLSIPISQATVITNDRIAQYRPKQDSKDSKTVSKKIVAAKGISVSIDLSVNPDAEIALIFDEKRGDILRGTGRGDMQMRFERSGDINMYGNYEVNKGEYLFTLFGAINKLFAIRPGGSIRWSGDPLGAIIDLNADYKGLTASLYNLLLEYQGTIDDSELRAQSDIDLGMHLFGELFKPEISFNLNVPNLTGNLRNIVDSKLNLLKADQNALNQQIMGLLVWGSFLPPNQLIPQAGVVGPTLNTVSQFLSSQISLLVENALKELVADNNVLSGFDFDINYFNNNNQVANINSATVIDQFNLSLNPKFLDDRLSVDVGANYINSTRFNQLITPHFEVEYAITRDRRLKVRAFARKDDISQGQLRDRIGGGLTWRREFNNIKEFFQGVVEESSAARLNKQEQ